MNETQISRLKEYQICLDAIPQAIENALQDRRLQLQNQSDKDSEIKIMELGVRQVVSDETVDGKKVYSNQQQRDDETVRRLNENPAFRKLRSELNETMSKIKELNDTIQILEYKLQVAKKSADIELAIVNLLTK